MGSLIYSANCSLDGYINDANGSLDWSAPSEELFAFFVETLVEEEVQLYGRRTYEAMHVWETDPSFAEAGELERKFTDWWMGTTKVVYSSTLPEDGIITGNTRLERSFDPEAVRRLKEETTGDLSIFGPTLAAHAFDADLVDEVRLQILPVTIGGGTPAFPRTTLSLDLREQRRFADGTVHLRYTVRR